MTKNEKTRKDKTGIGTTEVVFIMDRSGSMSGLEADTIGGFNSMLERQKKEDGEIIWSTVLFDDVNEVVHDRLPVDRVEKLTEEEMRVIATLERNNRLVKGQVFLWEGAKDWHDLWDEDGVIVK